MKYPRPAYNAPGIKTTTNKTVFGALPIVAPVFDTPISRKENFFRAARRDKPVWAPIAYTDIQTRLINELADEKPEENGRLRVQLGPRFTEQPRYDYLYLDPYGNSWSWVAEAGGAMLTPGTKLLHDICDWEKEIKLPDINDWNYRETAEKFMKEEYDPDKVMHINIHQGLTEMLVAFTGGYEEGMVALAAEPEAVADFFEFYAQHMIDHFDYLDTLYPIDFITYHDDWGTERDTFFSERMMEDLVFAPTKKIIDHIKGKGKVFELHTCGKIERFLPFMCDLGIDFLQIQRRANDIPMLKEKYGNRIGFNAPLEGYDRYTPGVSYPDDVLVEMIRNTVDIYCKGGGVYPSLYVTDPEQVWLAVTETYYYSKEYYEK